MNQDPTSKVMSGAYLDTAVTPAEREALDQIFAKNVELQPHVRTGEPRWVLRRDAGGMPDNLVIDYDPNYKSTTRHTLHDTPKRPTGMVPELAAPYGRGQTPHIYHLDEAAFYAPRKGRAWSEEKQRFVEVSPDEAPIRHVFSDGSGGLNREFSWWPCHGRYKGGNWWVHDRKGYGNDGPACVDDFGSLVRCLP